MSIKDKLNFDEKMTALNKFFIDISGKFKKTSKKIKLSIGGGIGAAAIIIIVVAVTNANMAYSLSVDGKDLGYIDNSKQVASIISAEKEKIKTELKANEINFDESRILVAKADLKADKVKLLTDKELSAILTDKKLYSVNAWAIKVDGKSIVSSSNESDAKAVVDGVKKTYKAKSSDLISATFKEKVEIANEITPVSSIMDVAKAEKYILNGTSEAKTYVVKDGDTMWDIAYKSGMSPYELQAANPGFSPDKLKIGQTLNMYKKKPFVNVVTVEQVATNKDIPYKTVYENSNALYKGDVKVKTKGIAGQEEVLAQVTKENGVWISTKVLSTKTIAEPKSAVALKGTNALSTYVGSGFLSRPLGLIGSISSQYGASRGGGSRSHTGIDIRAPKGTPIKVADDGVVIFAGYGGSYGKLIKVSHGKGVVTWYGHCNTMNVKVGEKVNKGQVIGTVGITGDATGYHLHFEVRINDVPANPNRYL